MLELPPDSGDTTGSSTTSDSLDLVINQQVAVTVKVLSVKELCIVQIQNGKKTTETRLHCIITDTSLHMGLLL